MPIEYLFGALAALLPVATLSGWFFGRRERKRNTLSSRQLEFQAYYTGLNYLLEDRPDKAIDVFLRVMEAESDTVETHFALANLFRRRGEVERAIRIHENLVGRSTLSNEQRNLAALELGLDYLRSGLLDRAETVFLELLNNGVHEQQALENLIDIYQQEQDWQKALDYSEKLETLSRRDLSAQKAQFVCEQAEILLCAGRDDEAAARILGAINIDSRCVRASLIAARLAIKQDKFDFAIHHLNRIEYQNQDFLTEAVPLLAECYRKLGREVELEACLERLRDLHPGADSDLALVDLLWKRGETDRAMACLSAELAERPTVQALDRLVRYLDTEASGNASLGLRMLKQSTARLVEQRAAYLCSLCGFRGRSLHWQCPGCKSWSSIKQVSIGD